MDQSMLAFFNQTDGGQDGGDAAAGDTEKQNDAGDNTNEDGLVDVNDVNGDGNGDGDEVDDDDGVEINMDDINDATGGVDDDDDDGSVIDGDNFDNTDFQNVTGNNNNNNKEDNSNSNSDDDGNNDKDMQLDLMELMQKYERKLALARDDYLRIEQEYGDQIQELNDNIFQLEDELRNKDRDIQELEKKQKTSEIESEQLNTLRSDYAGLSHDYDNLRKQYDALVAEDYPNRVHELETKVTRYEQIIDNLKTENKRLSQENDSVRNKLDEITEIKNKNDGIMEAYKIENWKLKEKIENKFGSIENDYNELKRNYDMLSTYAKQQAHVINQLSKMAPNIEHLTETFQSVKMSEKQIESIGVGTESETFYSHLGRLSNASEILEKSNFADSLQKEAEMEDEIDAYKEKFEEMRREMTQKNNRIEILTSELKNLTQNDGLLANYRALEDRYESLNNQIVTMERSVSNLTKEITERDRLIKAIVKDKYETVNVLANQLDFLRNLIKEHNLTVNLDDIPNQDASPGLFSYLTSWISTIGGDGDDTTGGVDDVETMTPEME